MEIIERKASILFSPQQNPGREEVLFVGPGDAPLLSRGSQSGNPASCCEKMEHMEGVILFIAAGYKTWPFGHKHADKFC